MSVNLEISQCLFNSSKTEPLQLKSTSSFGNFQADVFLNSGRTATLASKFKILHHKPKEIQQVPSNRTIYPYLTQSLFRVQWTRRTILTYVPSSSTKLLQSASCPAQSILEKSISLKISTKFVQSRFEETPNSKKLATSWTRSGVLSA